jgi:hypothetical protein
MCDRKDIAVAGVSFGLRRGNLRSNSCRAAMVAPVYPALKMRGDILEILCEEPAK